MFKAIGAEQASDQPNHELILLEDFAERYVRIKQQGKDGKWLVDVITGQARGRGIKVDREKLRFGCAADADIMADIMKPTRAAPPAAAVPVPRPAVSAWGRWVARGRSYGAAETSPTLCAAGADLAAAVPAAAAISSDATRCGIFARG